MADQRTMPQLLQAPTEGYEDAIVVPAITADNFELKHGLLTLVQNNEAWDRFKDLLRACPHCGFSELHQLYTFYNALNSKDQDSLNSAAGSNFLDKMPRGCLTIIESKYKVRYSRNKPVVAKVSTNTSTSGISPDVAELKDMVKALLLDKKSQNQAHATVKAVEESRVTCGGAHSYRNFPATDGNVYRDNIQEFVSQASAVNYSQGNTSYRPPMMNNQNHFNQNQNQGNNFNHGPVYQPLVFQPPAYQAHAYQAPAPQTQGVSKEDFSAYVKANDAVMRNMQTQGQNMQNQLTNLTDLLTNFVNSNNASTSSSGTLPSNIIANPRSDLKAITTRSGVSYDGPQIPPPPSFLPRVMENEPEATKDTVHPTNNESSEDVQPQVVQSKFPILTSEPGNSPMFEPVISPVSSPRPNLRPSIPYPSRMQDQKLRDKANDQPCKNSIERTLLGGSPKEVARKTRRPRQVFDSIVDKISLPDLTPTCMTLELVDRSISHPVGVAEDVYVKVGSFHFLTDFIVVDFDADPRVLLILKRSFLKTGRALIDVFEGELTLRVGKETITFNLDQTSRYSANYNDITAKRIDVIDMVYEENPTTATQQVFEMYQNVKQEIRDQLNAEAEAVQIILTGIDNDIYSTVDACPNALNEIRAKKIARVANLLALVSQQQQQVYHPQTHPTHYNQHSSTRSHQAATKKREKAIVNSPQLIYDQEPSMVDDEEDTSKDKEIDKLMALISLSFKKIYKPTNNNLRTSSNTSSANQDNSPQIHRNAGYERQRSGTVAGARETVGSSMVKKSGIQCYNYKEYGHVARECQKPKRAKDAAYHREKMLLFEKLKSKITDFKNKNKSLIEANNKLSEEIRDQPNAEAKAVQIILTGIDNDIYSTVDACPNAYEIWKAIERLKQGESINVQDLETNLFWEFEKFTSLDGESLESYYSRFYKLMNELTRNKCKVINHQVNLQFLLQLQPEWQRFVTLVKQSQELRHVSYRKLYDILNQHQHEVNEIRARKIARVANPLALSKDKEIDKLMALISLSFKKIYKPTNNNLGTSSNTSRANQDNSPWIHKNAGYEGQRSATVAGARDTVGSLMVQKSRIQCYNCKEYGHVARECQKPKRAKDAAYHREKMLLCKQEEAGIQLNAKQADWRDDTDDESDDQELEAHYMYMAKLQ
nr:reverse transcriptase domain-containing protein [Tanacetum cinerariifolium]